MKNFWAGSMACNAHASRPGFLKVRRGFIFGQRVSLRVVSLFKPGGHIWPADAGA